MGYEDQECPNCGSGAVNTGLPVDPDVRELLVLTCVDCGYRWSVETGPGLTVGLTLEDLDIELTT